MNNNFRYLLAGVLVFLIILLQPLYLKWLGYESNPVSIDGAGGAPVRPEIIDSPRPSVADKFEDSVFENEAPESFITVVTPLYTATISSRSGGSLNNYTLTQLSSDNYKHKGSYDEYGVYDQNMPVSLILSTKGSCLPCLAVYNDREDKYNFINAPFRLIGYPDSPDTVFLSSGESVNFRYVLNDVRGNILVQKSLSFYADNFISKHDFTVNDDHLDYVNSLELMWVGGLRPSERREDEDVQYGSGIISQAGEIEDIQTKGPDKNIDRIIYNGQTEWAATV